MDLTRLPVDYICGHWCPRGPPGRDLTGLPVAYFSHVVPWGPHQAPHPVTSQSSLWIILVIGAWRDLTGLLM